MLRQLLKGIERPGAQARRPGQRRTGMRSHDTLWLTFHLGNHHSVVATTELPNCRIWAHVCCAGRTAMGRLFCPRVQPGGPFMAQIELVSTPESTLAPVVGPNCTLFRAFPIPGLYL